MFNCRQEWLDYLKNNLPADSTSQNHFAIAIYEQDSNHIDIPIQVENQNNNLIIKEFEADSNYLCTDKAEQRNYFEKAASIFCGDYAYCINPDAPEISLPEKLFSLEYVSAVECIICALQHQVFSIDSNIFWAKTKNYEKKVYAKPRFETRDEWQTFIFAHMGWPEFVEKEECIYDFDENGEIIVDMDSEIFIEPEEIDFDNMIIDIGNIDKSKFLINEQSPYALVIYELNNRIVSNIIQFFHMGSYMDEEPVDMSMYRFDVTCKESLKHFVYNNRPMVGVSVYEFESPMLSNFLPEKIHDIQFLSRYEVILYRLQQTLNALSNK